MPMPLSSTTNVIFSSVSSIDNTIFPPSGVYLKALEMRLDKRISIFFDQIDTNDRPRRQEMKNNILLLAQSLHNPRSSLYRKQPSSVIAAQVSTFRPVFTEVNNPANQLVQFHSIPVHTHQERLRNRNRTSALLARQKFLPKERLSK